MITRPTAGLLLLFPELYDKNNSEQKNAFGGFVDEIVNEFSQFGIQIIKSPICMRKQEIEEAIHNFNDNNACAIVLLFLAYHPSLESAEPLTQSGLPLVILDTTMSYSFGPDTDPAMISYCHGIHGVQDLCCVLRRMGKKYMLEAGHYVQSDVISRVSDCIRACYMSESFKKSRVGIIGKPFKGMGDFQMPFDKMEKQLGIKTIPLLKDRAASLLNSFGPEEIKEQVKHESAIFTIEDNMDERLIELAALQKLALSKWVEQDSLDALTFNFLDFNNDTGLPVIPFTAVSELMGEGIGYAGEGDVLTAALVASVMKVYPDASFVEMFCPDWKGQKIFLSHMGEANHKLLSEPVIKKTTVRYTPHCNNGVIPGISGTFIGGDAVLVNLSPGPEGEFLLILAPCRVVQPAKEEDRFIKNIRGWMETSLPVESFLKEYSLLGGTHHSCLCYGADLNILKMFGEAAGWKVEVLNNLE